MRGGPIVYPQSILLAVILDQTFLMKFSNSYSYVKTCILHWCIFVILTERQDMCDGFAAGDF